MSEIKTFVFFDIETTGIPGLEIGRTKIIELALVACSKNHILEAKKGDIPRVLSKITQCVNPRKIIQHQSTQLNGLDNLLLEKTQEFNKTIIEYIQLFFNLLEAPICLVAHNGDKFDFPIFCQHFSFLNSVIPDILCVDSIKVFKEIDLQLEQSMTSQSSEPISDSGFSEFSEHAFQLLQHRNDTTPTHSKIDNSKLIMERPSKRSRRCLFPSPSFKNSYKLIDIYVRTFQSNPPIAHYAEEDCLNLLKCVVAMENSFCEIAEKHATKLSNFM